MVYTQTRDVRSSYKNVRIQKTVLIQISSFVPYIFAAVKKEAYLNSFEFVGELILYIANVHVLVCHKICVFAYAGKLEPQ